MKRILIPLLLSLSIAIPSNAQTQAFKDVKSLDIYHYVLQVLQNTYVDSVKTDNLVYKSIAGMLSSLDPYTELYQEEDNETLQMMTTGSYGGVGALIRKLPGQEVVITEPYVNSPAYKSGLVAGDTLVAIDGVSVLELAADEASAKMKGMPGSSVCFTLHRLGTGKIEDVMIVRERVRIPDILIAATLPDSSAYIRLNGFTYGGADDFRKAFNSLREAGPVKGLILDLRANGGGSVDEAVKILSMFLPHKTMVVSALGRAENSHRQYFTETPPIDTLLPIAVLVDRGSASASEIIAGAIQDLDRGCIIGQRTYGKGLVQAIEEMSYGSHMKVTTAKYYTPSGRCVQAIDYSHRNEDGSVGLVPDSLIKAFKTRSGRTVYDGGGIQPDIPTDPEYLSRIAQELYYKDFYFEYSLKYFISHPQGIGPSESFSLSDSDFADFVNFVKEKDFDHRSATEIMYEDLLKTAKMEGISESASAEIAALQKRISLDKEADVYFHRKDIQTLLEEEICCRYYLQRGRYSSMLRGDGDILKAQNYIAKPQLPSSAK